MHVYQTQTSKRESNQISNSTHISIKPNKYLYGCKTQIMKTRQKEKKMSFHENQKVFGTQNFLGPRKLGL
jgi:hypothetical protein